MGREMRSEQFVAADGVTYEMAIASAAVVYTNAKKITRAASMSVSYIATSAGNIKLQIEIEQSWRKPTTEYVADASYVVGESVNDVVSSLADATQHHKGSLGQITLPYIRLKITGLAGDGANAATTTLNARLNVQEAD